MSVTSKPIYALSLDSPIENIPGVGSFHARGLTKLGITTIYDFLTHFPSRYLDYSLKAAIRTVQPGEVVTISGTVTRITSAYTRHGKNLQKAVVTDESGSIDVIWFNQPFLIRLFPPGTLVNLAGKVDWFGKSIVIVSPEYEKQPASTPGRPASLHTGRLVPVYPETSGLSSKWIRTKMTVLLEECATQFFEYLPDEVLKSLAYIPYPEAIQSIHFPTDKTAMEKARRRLAFDELFTLRLASALQKEEWQRQVVGNILSISAHKDEIASFWQRVPFTLTAAQKRAVVQIFHDLNRQQPMNRLLEGDVGSGKTVVAAVAMYVTALNGYQSALMAPTEILAHQHYKTISDLLLPLSIRVGLTTASTRIQEPEENRKEKPGQRLPLKKKLSFDVLVGTHALLSESAHFNRLGLVVIDEQHRFGVRQRAQLQAKGINPHVLTMTATPIPRTVALTIYSELDLSYLDEMPKGRKTVKTWVVASEKREAAYAWIRKQIAAGEQAFIICPLVEESDHETLQTVRAATVEYQKLQKGVFGKFSLGLLHGRLSAKDKARIIGEFRSGAISILVATAVVEVGIDIPRATIIVIEAAERFGLAQLHQLRGRVGRGEKESYCLLFSTNSDPQTGKRLRFLETHHTGKEIAEIDLVLRGPGEFFGTRQHGITTFKIADLREQDLVREVHWAVEELLKRHRRHLGSTYLQQRLQRSRIGAVVEN